jgi:hypothetical protein
MATVTKKQFESAALYSARMEETKIRFASIQALMRGDYAIDPPFIREFCFSPNPHDLRTNSAGMPGGAWRHQSNPNPSFSHCLVARRNYS